MQIKKLFHYIINNTLFIILKYGLPCPSKITICPNRDTCCRSVARDERKYLQLRRSKNGMRIFLSLPIKEQKFI
jgi:hypothetical protein